ncbi:5-oxoprolinase subunit PxpB [Dyella soli]|uniref:5-oxoprolinase subunit PxpB n=1 Tax=Dyella soli TaxID=522319 RepID=A0A4R0YQQ9_9GAMM|nr:5-oxoprolinase subunit PxpB [Dyella soli]TCI08805.1 5-oxoprolinase subunit PxpB [Dyella soli]
MGTEPVIETFAEDALLLRFGSTIEPRVNAQVHAAAAALRERLPGVECVPAYASLLLRFEPADWRDADGAQPGARLREAVIQALRAGADAVASPREVTVPVWYGGAAGPDLAAVAAHARFAADEVIARHCGATYRVAMLGFAPGFPYLLGLDPALAMPRRTDPRLSVPTGSVAIGGNQTGIYPQTLPGGWQLIGRTPLALFDLGAPSPSLLQPGDCVRFQAIDEDAFRRLAAAAEAGR